ncbi:hypothetical protein [Reichenbachiella sp. MALMAid0571]|uniref:hypothetical protein n=1 Tax=Reichenbachiella sp. MALMAid0571 TaxID=3143939 RepID=UPI0032DE35F9
MMKYSNLAIALMAIISMGCSVSGILPSRAIIGINIDGSDEDWPTLTHVNVSEQTSYGIYNDDQNVYLLLKTYDSELIKKSDDFGITVWVDGNGAKSKNLGIVYTNAAKIDMDKRRHKYNPEDNPELLLAGKPALIRGVRKVGSKYEWVDISGGDMNAAVRIDEDKKELIYEAQFSLYYVQELAKKKNIEQGKLSFLVEIGSRGVGIGGGASGFASSGLGMRGGLGGIGVSMGGGGISRYSTRINQPPNELIPHEIFIRSFMME